MTPTPRLRLRTEDLKSRGDPRGPSLLRRRRYSGPGDVSTSTPGLAPPEPLKAGNDTPLESSLEVLTPVSSLALHSPVPPSARVAPGPSGPRTDVGPDLGPPVHSPKWTLGRPVSNSTTTQGRPGTVDPVTRCFHGTDHSPRVRRSAFFVPRGLPYRSVPDVPGQDRDPPRPHDLSSRRETWCKVRRVLRLHYQEPRGPTPPPLPGCPTTDTQKERNEPRWKRGRLKSSTREVRPF